MKKVIPKEDIQKVVQQVERRQQQGYGIGDGPDYTPYKKNYQISSCGNKRVYGSLITKRPMFSYSGLETKVSKVIHRRRNPAPHDIKEQYLLDVEEMIEICTQEGICHPLEFRTGLPRPRTTDLVVDWDTYPHLTREPIFIKPKRLMKKPRIQDLFKIEEVYWKRRNCVLSLATEDYITPLEWANIAWFHESRADIAQIPDDMLARISALVIARLARPDSLARAAQSIAVEVGLEVGEVLTATRHILSNCNFVTLDGEPVFRSKRLVVKGLI